MSRRIFWPMLVVFSAILAALVALIQPGGILPQILLFWFMIICPGMSIIGLLHLQDIVTELVLAVALSLVLGVLVAETFLFTSRWSPLGILGILIAISLVGAGLQILNAIRAKKPESEMI